MMQIAPQWFRQSCRLQVAIKPSWSAGAAAQYKPRGHLGATGSAALANAGRTAGDRTEFSSRRSSGRFRLPRTSEPSNPAGSEGVECRGAPLSARANELLQAVGRSAC